MTPRGINTKARKHQRLLWLLTHRSEWERFTSLKKLQPETRALFEKMQQEGLFAPGTNWFDANIAKLVEEARKVLNGLEPLNVCVDCGCVHGCLCE